jgi:hypothetical protein
MEELFMKINEFINTYNKNNKQATFNVAKLLNVKTYVPVLRKRQLAELVYQNSISFENGLVKVDSLTKYLIFSMLMISEYTDLEFTVDENGSATAEAIAEYDALCEAGLVDVVISCFAADYGRANEILNYVFKDNLAVSNTVEAVVGGLVENINEYLGNLAESLKNKIDNFDMDLSNVDMSQFENIINLLGSANK